MKAQKTGFFNKLSLQFSWVSDGVRVDTSLGAYSFRLSNFQAKIDMAHCLYAGGIALIGKAMAANAVKEAYLFTMDEEKQSAMIFFDGSLITPDDSTFVNYAVDKLNKGACGFNISTQSVHDGYNSGACAAWVWSGVELIRAALPYDYNDELTVTLFGHDSTKCWNIADSTLTCVGDLLHNAPFPMATIQKWTTSQILEVSGMTVSLCGIGFFAAGTIYLAKKMHPNAHHVDEEQPLLLNRR